MKIEIEFNKSSVHEHELKMDMIAKVEGTKKELTISIYQEHYIPSASSCR